MRESREPPTEFWKQNLLELLHVLPSNKSYIWVSPILAAVIQGSNQRQPE